MFSGLMYGSNSWAVHCQTWSEDYLIHL